MRLLAPLSLVLWPAAALACGGCLDANLTRHGWWADALAVASFPLIPSAVVLGVLRCLSGGSVRGVLGSLFAALVLAIGVSSFAMGSAIVLLSTLGLALIVVFVRWWVLAEKRKPLIGLGTVLALILAGGFFLKEYPSAQTTESLVSLSHMTLRGAPGGYPPNWKLEPLTWVERELLARKDAATVLAEELKSTPGDPVVVRLDALVRGVSAQPKLCDAWRETQKRLYEGNCPSSTTP